MGHCSVKLGVQENEQRLARWRTFDRRFGRTTEGEERSGPQLPRSRGRKCRQNDNREEDGHKVEELVARRPCAWGYGSLSTRRR